MGGGKWKVFLLLLFWPLLTLSGCQRAKEQKFLEKAKGKIEGQHIAVWEKEAVMPVFSIRNSTLSVVFSSAAAESSSSS